MKNMTTTLASIFVAVALSLVVGASPATAASSNQPSVSSVSTQASKFKKGYQYQCKAYSVRGASQYKTWTGSPKKCKTTYRVVNSKGKIVLQINKPQKSLAQIAGKSWKSANKWCGANSLTCTILTTVGFAAVKALL
ncbi:hypothetical protein [Brevibacterium aurantiacum]|uniref:hypothetical protein n=1 Tax=Brevibacterium aurantiacum TaxID=273384 RepID=UPI000DF15F17|nr:hypothetical protein [Brevibacterium aurantiacum]MDN5585191.1 hypothetical protein [Brevibacterium sp.]RCS89835.1 hypothetical protein CIK63_07295 [Brevibacterium aurantiacum]